MLSCARCRPQSGGYEEGCELAEEVPRVKDQLRLRLILPCKHLSSEAVVVLVLSRSAEVVAGGGREGRWRRCLRRRLLLSPSEDALLSQAQLATLTSSLSSTSSLSPARVCLAPVPSHFYPPSRPTPLPNPFHPRELTYL